MEQTVSMIYDSLGRYLFSFNFSFLAKFKMNAQQLFGTKDLYSILEVQRNASICEGNNLQFSLFIVYCLLFIIVHLY